MNVRILFAASLFFLASGWVGAETWERFRGPKGEGVAHNQNLPIELDVAKNLVWKVAIPGVGHSSPIIWNGRVLVQSASANGSERYLLCLDAKTGKTVWEKKTAGAKAHTHQLNSLASATPATDGKAVYLAVWDGKDVILSALTIDGEPIWEKSLGEFKSQHGPGASPVVHGDKLFFALDMDGKAAMFAFDKNTGKQVWTQPREAFRASYSAPQILDKGANGVELIVTSTTAITSYDPDTGSRNWNWTWTWPANTKPLRTIASSVEAGNMLFACAGDGDGSRQMAALNLPTAVGGTPVQAWDNKKIFPYVPCLLSRDGRIYFVNDHGFAGCFDAKSGKQVWYERVPGAKFTASPVLVDGKIYAASDKGDVFVMAAEPKFEILGRGELGEDVRATPAVANGRIVIRGARHLFCFGKKD
jgi:outer membrane protein assembly factor BamB